MRRPQAEPVVYGSVQLSPWRVAWELGKAVLGIALVLGVLFVIFVLPYAAGLR